MKLVHHYSWDRIARATAELYERLSACRS
jgi:hypothetical protein